MYMSISNYAVGLLICRNLCFAAACRVSEEETFKFKMSSKKVDYGEI